MNTSTISHASPPQGWMHRTTAMVPGLLLAGAIAAAATWLAQFPAVKNNGLSALTLAIIIGLVIGNTVYPAIASQCGSGIAFTKARLLRTGIVLYGLRLTFQDIGQVGMAGVVIDALVLSSTFLLAQWIGQKLLGMDKRTTLLVGAGASICGAAAVLATEPVAKGRAEDVAVAVATVVVFGTIGTFLYPALFHWNAEYGWIDTSMQQYGVFVGSTVHEVAQVVAAGEAIGSQAADTAVIAKMVRVMMLAPFLVILSAVLARGKARSGSGDGKASKLAMPWFAFIFIGVVAFNSLGLLPAGMVATITELDTALLAMAMAALGLTTHMSAIGRAGIKPLLLAGLLFCWLIAGGAAINHVVASLFA